MSSTEERSDVSGAGPCRKLHEYSSREVAEELCLIDSELLRKIDTNELRNGAWMKKEKKYSLAPNIMAMVSAFNQLALLIPSEILDERTPQARAKVISTFIKVAHKCHSFGNYNSLKAVLAGLQCTPIFRLKKTWKEVPSKKRKRFQYLCDRMSEDNNWKHYREEIERRVQTQSPLIPFLGVFLTTVALSQEADNLAEVASSRERLDSHKRRRDSLYENYVILEAVTVRKRLEKLRSLRSCDDPTESHSHTSILRESDGEINDLDSTISPNHQPFTESGTKDASFTSSIPLPVHVEERVTTDSPARASLSSKSDRFLKSRSLKRSLRDDFGADLEVEHRNGGILCDHVTTADVHDSIDFSGSQNGILSEMGRDQNSNDVTKDRITRQKNRFEYRSISCTEDGHTHTDHALNQDYCIDQPAALLNHVDTRHSSADKSLDSNEKPESESVEPSPKERTKKKRITLRSLRFRKKKLTSDEITLTPSPKENTRKASVLSGSLECLIDAVQQEDTPPPECGEITRSISLFNMSAELDGGEENSYMSDTTPSLTSEMSMQSEYHTSNESLQRLKSDDGSGVTRRAKRDSVHSLSDKQDQQQLSHENHRPTSLLTESKKLEYRHSLKTIDDDKPRRKATRHMRNRSDTSMLPTFQHAYMYTCTTPVVSSPKHNSSSQNILQSLHDHIKSMPNVFRRERGSKPIVPELGSSPLDPISLLIQYQFLSLRCCVGVAGHPHLRQLILEGNHNSEGQNYKLSFEREPN